MITVKHNVYFGGGRRGKRELRDGDQAAPQPAGRVPRISRLMALAIRFDQLIRDGVVVDQAALARLGHVSRARVTQIMNLLNLAPDIQEKLLFLPPTERGQEPIPERAIRPIAAIADWGEQRRRWGEIKAAGLGPIPFLEHRIS